MSKGATAQLCLGKSRVLVIYCLLTNDPKTYWLKTTFVILRFFVGQEEGIIVSCFRRLPPAASRSKDEIGGGRPA